MLLSSYRHESGHYIVVPRLEDPRLRRISPEMEFLGEMHLSRFASAVRAKILKGGVVGSEFVHLDRREFMRLRRRPGRTDCA